MRSFVFVIFLFFLFPFGCGYHWQQKINPWKNRGIEKVYVEILKNNSLKAGAEVPFTSALVKMFSRGNKVRVVSEPTAADAIVQGAIDSISSSIGPRSTVPTLTTDPQAATISDMLVATEYQVSAALTVTLVDQKSKSVLWSQGFSGNKFYPGNNRFGLVGNTSALINDSQQQLALQDIAQILASDVYDTMLEVF